MRFLGLKGGVSFLGAEMLCQTKVHDLCAPRPADIPKHR
jgi:hypothetical protein